METGVWQEGFLGYIRCHRVVHDLLATFMNVGTRDRRTQRDAEKMGHAIKLFRVLTHCAKPDT